MLINEADIKRGFSASNADEVTKSDTYSTMPWYDATALSGFAEYLYVTGAGDLAVVMAGGQTVVQTMAANSYFWGRVKTVKSTGTSATGIVGYWM